MKTPTSSSSTVERAWELVRQVTEFLHEGVEATDENVCKLVTQFQKLYRRSPALATDLKAPAGMLSEALSTYSR